MSSWHVDTDLIDRFVHNDPIDHVTAASIEQHLAACPACRLGVAERTGPDLVDDVWSAVVERIDRSHAGIVERSLVRARIEPAPARLLGATPGLRAATLLAVSLVVAVVVWASRVADAAGLFLALAPVVPTALVAISFAANAEPGGEGALATPEYGGRLLLRRALAVEVLALAVLGLGAVFVPLDGGRAVAWLLPATALSAATVAAGARWPTTHAAAVLVGGWFGVLAVGEALDGRSGGPPFADAAAFGATGQVVALAVLGGAVSVVSARRHTLFQEVVR